MVNFSKIGMSHHNKCRRIYNKALFSDLEIDLIQSNQKF